MQFNLKEKQQMMGVIEDLKAEKIVFVTDKERFALFWNLSVFSGLNWLEILNIFIKEITFPI